MPSPTTISRLDAWQALDSRGHPTVACRATLTNGVQTTALVPAGASTGSHEALDLRDGGPRYAGRGVRTAVRNVTTVLAGAVHGVDVLDPEAVDASLRAADPTPGFARLGANAVLSVSLAAAKAAARANGVPLARHLIGERDPLPLPMPMVNIISGGAHAGSLIDVQDYLVIPVGACSFGEAIEWAGAVRNRVGELAARGGHRHATLVADEGGLGLALASNRGALELLVAGIEAAGFAPAQQVAIGMDVAATQLLDGEQYRFDCEARRLSTSELIGQLDDWCRDYPIVSLEDPLAEDDWQGWQQLTRRLGTGVQLIGDDLFATDADRLGRGVRDRIANAVLVKVNQNGLLRGARQVLDDARAAGYRTVVSARSGETEDSWLADLAIGWRAGQIKVGSTTRSERTAKWNRLLELEAVEHTEFCGPWPDGRPPDPPPPPRSGDDTR